VGKISIFFDLVTVSPESGQSIGKDTQNCEEIGNKFLLGTVNSFVENHDLSTVLFNQELYDFSAESGESIPMGNNKAEFITSQDAFQ